MKQSLAFGRFFIERTNDTRQVSVSSSSTLNSLPITRLRKSTEIIVPLNDAAFQKCISATCGKTYEVDQVLTGCPSCGHLLDVCYDWDRIPVPTTLSDFEKFWAQRFDRTRFSGVWRFHELLSFADQSDLVTLGEGQTILQQADGLAEQIGVAPGRLHLQYEGLNPSGSFKDNGMTAALTHAKATGATHAACASTGNTSASLAMYAAASKALKAIIFIGSGKIAFGKLSQALDYGALTVQIEGDFDDAMARVREVCPELNIYLVNSVNPFRLEGQKTVMLRVLEQLRWEVPDWIVVPGGNLGNSSSFGKCFSELKQLGLIDRIPRLAIINADGASTLHSFYNNMDMRWNEGRFDLRTAQKYFRQLKSDGKYASTLASAIEINLPVNLTKCLRALEICDGVVASVSDTEILNAKANIARNGFGCEPASAASVAGLQKLMANGTIHPDQRIVCVLTGHQLKDPNATVGYHIDSEWKTSHQLGEAVFANTPVSVPNDVDEIIKVIESHSALRQTH